VKATLDARDAVKPLISVIDSQYRERLLEKAWQSDPTFRNAESQYVAGS
jgi:hypothetical protein